MASAEKLIQEAQFAFHNIGPGSTDEARNRTRAKRFALQVLRRYPDSTEAQQAREILDQMKVEHALATDTTPIARAEATATPVVAVPSHTRATASASPIAKHGGELTWTDLWQRFGELPQLQKNVAWAVLIFLAIILAFSPFLIIFLFLLLAKRDALRENLHKALVSLHPEASTWQRRNT